MNNIGEDSNKVVNEDAQTNDNGNEITKQNNSNIKNICDVDRRILI